GRVQAPDADGNFLFPQGSRGFQQSASFAVTDRTLTLFDQGVGHSIPWAFRGPLEVHPHAGDGFNAYYSRLSESINFYDGNDPKLGKTIHASESLDVVSHEAGHAILDGMKPGLLGWFGGVECEAFHESFGDVAAMLTALQDDRVIDRVIEQTSGDLRQDNVVAGLAEELSRGINDTVFDGQKPANWTIRNANNPLRYSNPSGLPDRPEDENQLGKEPHNFSRLFTGAVWDVMAGLVDRYRAEGQSPREALLNMRDVMLPLFARTVELGPNRMKKYKQMADAMVSADERYFGSANRALITQVFAARGIRPAQAASQEVPALKIDARDPDAWLATHRLAVGIPAQAPLKSEATWKNEQGETFVRYGYTEDVAIGPTASTELQGTLTLGFAADGSLFHRLWEPIDDEARDLAIEAIGYHMRSDEIRGAAPRTRADAVKSDGHPYAGYILQERGRNKIVRLPSTPGF
ncbi:MAG: hypothetical protein FJX76_21580, partial [Armatimonadetes bacterium]|nr:hypothetical protein [Armatimonadota bacterium]